MGRLAVLLSASIALLTPPTNQQPLYRSRVSLVSLNVTVQDTRARYVTGLQPRDFVVYEDGVRQEVRFVESTILPIDLIVLLDTSGSMADQIAVVREAARGFLNTLRDGDRGAVVAFNERASFKQVLTADRDALGRAIDSTEPGGRTALHTALYVALKQFGQSVRTAETIRRQAIAVLSDGEDNVGLVPFEEVLALARQTGVNVYTLRLQSRAALEAQTAGGLPRFFSETDYDMRTLARETGGLSFFPRPDQLRGVYEEIAKELANQYSIGYEPRETGTEPRFRKVMVEIAGRPDLKPRTRAGYTG